MTPNNTSHFVTFLRLNCVIKIIEIHGKIISEKNMCYNLKMIINNVCNMIYPKSGYKLIKTFEITVFTKISHKIEGKVP